MPDYNIYIHSAISSQETSSTTPWTSQPNIQPWNTETSKEVANAFSKASGVMMNPDSLISSGVSSIAKAIPWVAVVIVGLKILDKVVSTCIDYNALETGNYHDTIAWNNFKANLSWIFKPISNTYNFIQTQNKFRIDDYRKTQQRELLGDSVINTYTNRGI